MKPTSASRLITVLTVILAVCDGAYRGLGEEYYSTMGYLLWYLAAAWALTLWVRMDARERSLPLAFDQGLFVFVAWPVYIPVYLVRSRGIIGLAWVAVFVLLYGAVHQLVAWSVWFALL